MAIDNKKEQEREELHRAIWAIADELRGAVDGWDFKNYVLGTMFYRYISENIASYINQGEIDAGNSNFDYAKMSDSEAETARVDLVEEKGFFILPSELFCNVLKRCDDDENLNETLEKVFRHIEESAKGSASESDFEGLFDDFDVNSNKLGSTVAKRNDKLAKLLHGVADMNLGDVKDHDIDAFGDAYEYLMTMYASNAGKSGGEFFTPADVSELLTRLGTVGKTEINKVYDPACGSGSLLLKAEKVLGRDAIRNGFYGQEINITTYNLCRINMFLHDIGFDKFDIACEDTLVSPQHWDDEPFELIVSNPPYSIKWEGDANPLLINDPRFSPAGVLAPKSKADMAFIMHATDVENRRKQLSTTALPYDYEVYATYETAGNLEDKKLHKLIDNLNPDLRITKSREFFIMSPEDAYELLESIAIISGTKDKLKKVKVALSKKQKTKRPPVNFAKCGIPMGSELVFVEDDSVVVTVVGERKVQYGDEITSLSAISDRIKGYSTSGPQFFTYNGKTISQIAEETQWNSKDIYIL